MYEVEPVDLVENDFNEIYWHLIKSYIGFGEEPGEAISRATRRIQGLRERMFGLGARPFKGTLMPNVRQGLRRATYNDGIFYFEIDEKRKRVRILAVFFGGQDHLAQILDRLPGPRT